MASTITFNITLDKGADWSLDVTWKDGANVPVNLSNYDGSLQVRRRARDATAVAEFSTGADGRVTKDNATGKFMIRGSGGYTDTIPAGGYVYNFEATLIGSNPAHRERLLEGEFEVTERVNR